MSCTIGSFDYLGEGCVPVCVLTVNGTPVILFPPEGRQILPGKPYSIQFSTEGTKTREIDGKTYRVGHVYAATLQDVEE
jgi:hypothetical protein